MTIIAAGLVVPATADAHPATVQPPDLPAGTNLVVCADGGGGPVVADGPNFRSGSLKPGRCLAWAVHDGQYTVGLQTTASVSPAATDEPPLDHITLIRPGGTPAVFPPSTVLTHVAGPADSPTLGPLDSDGSPTGAAPAQGAAINVTTVVLHFLHEPPTGGGGPTGGGDGPTDGGRHHHDGRDDHDSGADGDNFDDGDSFWCWGAVCGRSGTVGNGDHRTR